MTDQPTPWPDLQRPAAHAPSVHAPRSRRSTPGLAARLAGTGIIVAALLATVALPAAGADSGTNTTTNGTTNTGTNTNGTNTNGAPPPPPVPTTNYGNRTGSNVLPDIVQAQAQCNLGVTASKSSDVRLAQQIMNGSVPIEKYGTMVIASNPTWRPQSGLDSSGDAHMGSLHYLMPLLRVGVATGNTAMVDRFYGLIRDWSLDNRLGMAKPPNSAAWQPLYTGYRMQVIGCALAGPRGGELWLRQLAAVHANYVTTYRSSLASNNTGIQLAMGQYVIGCDLKNVGWKAAARTRLSILVSGLVFQDGSTNEGAVSYAKSDYDWFRLAASRIRLCGQPPVAALARVNNVPTFVAHAIRPDGRYEALGDTSPDRASTTLFNGTVAQWPASLGTSGRHPSATFASFSGGFIFGRSGWGTSSRPFTDQTFYSVRTGKGRSAGVFHAHADAGAVTLFANGQEQLFDTGQWKYQYGVTRDYVMSRTAHNVVSASGGGYTTSRAPAVTRANSNADRDLITLTDTGYRKNQITLTRTIMYSRKGEYLIVWDTAKATKKDKNKKTIARTFTQHWQFGPDRTTRMEPGRVSSQGPGSNVTLAWIWARPALSVGTGYVSTSYGQLAPAPVVKAVRKDTGANIITVILPRKDGVPPEAVRATGWIAGNAAHLTVTNENGLVERVTLTRTTATITR